MIINFRLVASIAAMASLVGCGTMSGLDASSSFSCKAAPGVSCQSISGVHQNANAGNLPFQQEENAPKVAAGEKKSYGTPRADSKISPKDMNAQYSGMPVRQPPLVLRVWMAPYEDDSGDLHDQTYFYTMVHSGKWMIEANRNAISNQFKPIYPLTRPTQAQELPVAPDREAQPLNQRTNSEPAQDRTVTQ